MDIVEGITSPVWEALEKHGAVQLATLRDLGRIIIII